MLISADLLVVSTDSTVCDSLVVIDLLISSRRQVSTYAHSTQLETSIESAPPYTYMTLYMRLCWDSCMASGVKTGIYMLYLKVC